MKAFLRSARSNKISVAHNYIEVRGYGNIQTLTECFWHLVVVNVFTPSKAERDKLL